MPNALHFNMNRQIKYIRPMTCKSSIFCGKLLMDLINKNKLIIKTY